MELERPQSGVKRVYDPLREHAEEAMSVIAAGPDRRGWQSLATYFAFALARMTPS